ncbi:hypothetical protein [Dactylosporangium sp. CA-233914]
MALRFGGIVERFVAGESDEMLLQVSAAVGAFPLGIALPGRWRTPPGSC